MDFDRVEEVRVRVLLQLEHPVLRGVALHRHRRMSLGGRRRRVPNDENSHCKGQR